MAVQHDSHNQIRNRELQKHWGLEPRLTPDMQGHLVREGELHSQKAPRVSPRSPIISAAKKRNAVRGFQLRKRLCFNGGQQLGTRMSREHQLEWIYSPIRWNGR